MSPVIAFFPGSGMFLQKPSPMSEYVLADLYGWLEANSGLSHSYATTPTATQIGINISSLNTNTTSSRSSSKR
ncbi:MAG: hypothetical protein WCF23_08000 [Candidatus Nitrosopolaris sp.]